jgi:TonB family protein
MYVKLAVTLAVSCMIAPWAASSQPAPTWIEAPSTADVASAYPAKARAAAVGGTVDMSCTVSRQGRPKACAVLREKPGSYAFGAAARKLAELMRVAETNLHDQEVLVSVTFNPDILKPGGATVTKPAWAAMPSINDFQATFPKAENGVNSVRVVLACTVEPGGVLGGCSVDSESPTGQGFGQGALALASKFRVGPWSQDGQPTVGARLRLPIRYELTQVSAKP